MHANMRYKIAITGDLLVSPKGCCPLHPRLLIEVLSGDVSAQLLFYLIVLLIHYIVYFFLLKQGKRVSQTVNF